MRRDNLFLLDVVEACQKIERFTAGKTFNEFSADEILVDATIRNLQNIGEAIRCLTEETRSLNPDIEWKRIVGLRHLLVHQYFGVDTEIVWDLAVNKCPDLLVATSELLSKMPSE